MAANQWRIREALRNSNHPTHMVFGTCSAEAARAPCPAPLIEPPRHQYCGHGPGVALAALPSYRPAGWHGIHMASGEKKIHFSGSCNSFQSLAMASALSDKDQQSIAMMTAGLMNTGLMGRAMMEASSG